jgi:hypothetical protein
MSCSHEIDNKNTIVTVMKQMIPQNVDKERRIRKKQRYVENMYIERERKKSVLNKSFTPNQFGRFVS